jgi:hypothetical protein
MPLFELHLDSTMRFRAKLKFVQGNSDLLTDVHAYNEAMKVRKTDGSSSFRNFCDDVFLSLTFSSPLTDSSRLELYLPKHYSRYHHIEIGILFYHLDSFSEPSHPQITFCQRWQRKLIEKHNLCSNVDEATVQSSTSWVEGITCVTHVQSEIRLLFTSLDLV